MSDHNPDVRLISAVAEALSVLIEPADFDSAVRECLRHVGDALDADRASVFKLEKARNGDADIYRETQEWARTAVNENDEPYALRATAVPHVSDKLIAGQPFWGLRRDFDQAEQTAFELRGVCSLVCQPIVIRSALWGFILVEEARREKQWTLAELECLRTVAAGLAGAFVRREMESSFRAQAEELRRHRRAALSLAEDARRSEHDAAQASAAKTVFLAMMSHEIRTPLNGVIGFTDLLLAEGLPERQSEITQAIKTCGETLLSLISDILDISKIESGKLDLHEEAVDVAASAKSVLATFEPMARKNGVALNLHLAGDVPPWLWLDGNRFCQILFNLVGNAVKFTAQGQIDLHLGVEPAAGGAAQLSGQVRDTGLGMSAEELSVIFEPFLQGDGARRIASGGSGLGLAICRRLLEAMGGTISVQSTPGAGSVFSFTLLVKEATPPGAVPEVAVDPVAENARVSKVLVVDDVFMNVRLVLSLLKRLGYTADTASSGVQAVQMVRETPYDLIFMDVLMPEMDGRQTVRKIREMQEMAGTSTSWIVALTADALMENRVKCAEAGMDDFLTKPLRLADIESAIGRWKARQSILRPVTVK